MDRKLLNYSLETDQVVLLHFSDGRSQRVEFDQIGDYLTGPDLAKVTRAIKLRKDFFRHNNLPGSLAAAVAIGLAVVLVADYHGVANIWRHTQPLDAAPAGASHARSIVTPSLSPSPSATLASTPAGPAADRAAALPAVPAAPPSNATGLSIPLPTPALKALEHLPVSNPKF